MDNSKVYDFKLLEVFCWKGDVKFVCMFLLCCFRFLFLFCLGFLCLFVSFIFFGEGGFVYLFIYLFGLYSSDLLGLCMVENLCLMIFLSSAATGCTNLHCYSEINS